MKTIVSLLLVICLVSCSQPKPKPQSPANFAPVEMSEEGPTVVHPPATPPPVTAEPRKEASPKAIAPAMPTDDAAQAKPPVALPPAAKTNAAVSPFARPSQPTVPAMTTPPVTPGASAPATANAQPEPLLPELSVNFHAAPIDLVLQTYADFVHRTLLRSPNINAQTTVTLVQQNALTKTELIEAMDAVLAMNNIAMIPIGEKFVKVVPLADAGGAGGKINEMNESMLPEFGPFDTHVVQLKYTKPSEMVPILQQFTKTPAAVLPIEGSGMVVLRDSAENVRRMLEMITRLDTAIPTEIESEVIPIKYALASDIANALNSISGTGGGSTFGGSGSGRTGSLGTSRTTGQGSARGFGGSTVGGGYNSGQVGQQGSVGGLGGGGLGGGGAGGLGGGRWFGQP